MDKEKDKKAYAHAEKAYMQGTLFPFIKVGMQKVNLLQLSLLSMEKRS